MEWDKNQKERKINKRKEINKELNIERKKFQGK